MITSTITHTLTSGQILTVPRSIDFGEIVIASLGLVLTGLMVLELVLSMLRRPTRGMD